MGTTPDASDHDDIASHYAHVLQTVVAPRADTYGVLVDVVPQDDETGGAV
jgi:hypothetical protein